MKGERVTFDTAKRGEWEMRDQRYDSLCYHKIGLEQRRGRKRKSVESQNKIPNFFVFDVGGLMLSYSLMAQENCYNYMNPWMRFDR